jgi:hypothetical protein
MQNSITKTSCNSGQTGWRNKLVKMCQRLCPNRVNFRCSSENSTTMEHNGTSIPESKIISAPLRVKRNHQVGVGFVVHGWRTTRCGEETFVCVLASQGECSVGGIHGQFHLESPLQSNGSSQARVISFSAPSPRYPCCPVSIVVRICRCPRCLERVLGFLVDGNVRDASDKAINELPHSVTARKRNAGFHLSLLASSKVSVSSRRKASRLEGHGDIPVRA